MDGRMRLFLFALAISLILTACARSPAANAVPAAPAPTASQGTSVRDSDASPASPLSESAAAEHIQAEERLLKLLDSTKQPSDLDAAVVASVFRVSLAWDSDVPTDRIASIPFHGWWEHLRLGVIYADERPILSWSAHADRTLSKSPDICVLPLDRFRQRIEALGYSGVNMDDGHHFTPHWSYSRHRTHVQVRFYTPASTPGMDCISTVSVQVARSED